MALFRVEFLNSGSLEFEADRLQFSSKSDAGCIAELSTGKGADSQAVVVVQGFKAIYRVDTKKAVSG